jgi:hypothetical protein
MKIAEILARKDKAAIAVQPAASLVDLPALLRAHHIGAAAVCSNG